MNVWQTLLLILVCGGSFVPFLINRRLLSFRARAIVSGGLLVPIIAGFVWTPRGESKFIRDLPRKVSDRKYVSSDSCKSCHPSQYASWHASYHRTMTQVATPETVLAPFDNVVLQSRGRSHILQRRNDEFWAIMPDVDWEAEMAVRGIDTRQMNPPTVARPIVMTTGSHHIQGYWVPSSPGNKLRLLPWSYHIAEQRWIPREDCFLEPPTKGRLFEIWNEVCIKCHSVGGAPGLDEQTRVVSSRVAELGIACESCHGPAEEHVAYWRNPLRRYRQHLSDAPDTTIVNPARTTQQASSQICGQCHSIFTLTEPGRFTTGCSYRPGDTLEQTHRILGIDGAEAHYWADGACRVGGDEYNGMIDSECYRNGKMTCLSCHSMHDSDPDDQLAPLMDQDEACLQCHSSYRKKIEEHTHHRAGSSGSRCYNCHMPHTAYALFTAMRSHRVDSPSLASSLQGRPNACNLCHLDKTLEWTGQYLSQWYGLPTEELTKDQREIAASVLWLLSGDAIQRVIVAWHMGWAPALEVSGTRWQAALLSPLLEDPYAAARYVAGRSLRQLPGFADFPYDFIGPDSDRAAARQRALNLWKEQPTPINPDPRILFGSDGVLSQQVERLLKQRDDRPVSIPE